MQVINNFSPTSKVWVYQAAREISEEEQEYINQLLSTFISSWNSHGAEVSGAAEIRYNRFIILVADDQAGVSGCSIDSSVKIIREIEAKFNLGLLDRSIISYKNGDSVKTTSLSTLKNEVAAQNITPDTIIFNNSVASLQEFESGWEQKAENSWMARFF